MKIAGLGLSFLLRTRGGGGSRSGSGLVGGGFHLLPSPSPPPSSTLATPLPRHLHLSTINPIKQIVREEEEGGKRILVQGRHLPSPRAHRLIPGAPPATAQATATTPTTPCPCPLCRLGLHIKHTDVLILDQFVDSRGRQIPRRVTGLCRLQYRRMDYLLVMAEKAGLMGVKDAEGVKRELVGWEAFNKYYDEGAIEEFLHYTTKRNRA